MKKLYSVFLFTLLAGLFASAQTTIYSNNFNNSTGWSLTAANNGDTWTVNSSYNCSEPTPNNGGGSYLHIYDDLFGDDCAFANYYGLGSSGSATASMSSDISTAGYSDVTISFSWLCQGNGSITPSYGSVWYSTNSGGAWTQINSPISKYSGQGTWTTATITSAAVPGIANQATLMLRFGWNNSGYGLNPAFAVDDLLIIGNGSACSNVGGTASVNPSAVCSGGTSNVSLTGSTGTIQWQESANGTSGWANVTGGSGSTTNSYTTGTLSASTYYRAVLSEASCADKNSSVASVTVNPPVTPALSISPSPSDSFCTGGTLTFTANPTAGGTSSPTFQWKINNTDVATGSTFSPVSLANNDLVSCVMTSNDLCASPTTATSNTITVHEAPLPAVPVITQSTDTLASSAATTYQWFRNNSMVPGGNNQNLAITQDGVYEVEVTGANGCKRRSATFNVIGTSISSTIGAKGIHLYPNPNQGSFTIETEDEFSPTVSITDLAGRLLSKNQVIINKQSVQLNEVANGIYFLHLNQKGVNESLRFVVLK
ncbi:MAG: T9SS type A sorting domain-containing protein [Bacteroidetes bacterium]|nr:T9SS type A sorting domain-containing protein [Bacteroidota bacterium]